MQGASTAKSCVRVTSPISGQLPVGVRLCAYVLAQCEYLCLSASLCVFTYADQLVAKGACKPVLLHVPSYTEHALRGPPFPSPKPQKVTSWFFSVPLFSFPFFVRLAVGSCGG